MTSGPEPRQLLWEEVRTARKDGGIFAIDWNVHRTRVPGGWLVVVIHNTSGLTFYPDPKHEWDGSSLP